MQVVSDSLGEPSFPQWCQSGVGVESEAVYREVLCLGLCVSWPPSCLCQTFSFAGPSSAHQQEPSERFVITVLVQDSFNPHLEVAIPIQLNRRFRVVKLDGSVKTIVSGILQRAIADDEFALTLTVSEPNQSDTQNFCRLRLDMPLGIGSMQRSTVFGRTVTVSRAPAAPSHAQ
jgi:hypothetical protein